MIFGWKLWSNIGFPWIPKDVASLAITLPEDNLNWACQDMTEGYAHHPRYNQIATGGKIEDFSLLLKLEGASLIVCHNDTTPKENGQCSSVFCLTWSATFSMSQLSGKTVT